MEFDPNVLEDREKEIRSRIKPLAQDVKRCIYLTKSEEELVESVLIRAYISGELEILNIKP